MNIRNSHPPVHRLTLLTRGAIVLLAASSFLAACRSTEPTVAPEVEPVVDVAPGDVETALEEEIDPSLVALDTVRAGRFDDGKMWTFDNPPLDYFEEAYGFRPDDTWMEHARMAALRFADNCSASFVSPSGLIMTNHHCARESITNVSETGENLLDNGFHAVSVAEERLVEGLFVEQLIEIQDVTEEVMAALEGEETDAERLLARREIIDEIERRMTQEIGGEDSEMRVQIISLYHGGIYSAYTFRRYDNIRLVIAPELQLGYFGGDPDNFTYPRYNMDFTFFRAYGEDGEPLETPHYFSWSENGASPGEAVFVIGNPGSTSRLSTVAQLEFSRDHEVPLSLRTFRNRVEIFREFTDANPEVAEEEGIRNLVFALDNAIKAYQGHLEGLHDPVLMARRRDSERRFREALEQHETWTDEYEDLFGRIAEIQREKGALMPSAGAFAINPTLGSVVLTRGLYGVFYEYQKRAGPEEAAEELREEILGFTDRPAELEQRLIAEQLRDMQHNLGESHAVVQNVLQGRTPDEMAAYIVANTAVLDSASFASLLSTDVFESDDPAFMFGQQVLQPLATFQRDLGVLEGREEELAGQLARARFDVFGTAQPPDATFSPRIADGVVQGYPYNGTIAPPFTTYYGLFERHSAFGGVHPWDLPERWQEAVGELNLAIPVNLVSTNDIIGGNSGSPLLNRDLQIVGLIFDGNIESLPGEFIYTEERARAISVDSRGIIEALESVYNARRVASELRTGQLVESEDAAASN